MGPFHKGKKYGRGVQSTGEWMVQPRMRRAPLCDAGGQLRTLSLSSTGRCHASGLPLPFPSCCGPLPVHHFRSTTSGPPNEKQLSPSTHHPFLHPLDACIRAILVDVPESIQHSCALLRCCWVHELGRSDPSSLVTPRFLLTFRLASGLGESKASVTEAVRSNPGFFFFTEVRECLWVWQKNRASLTKAVQPTSDLFCQGSVGSLVLEKTWLD